MSDSDLRAKLEHFLQGTWTGTISVTGQDNTVATSKRRMLISDRNAVTVNELTIARPAGGIGRHQQLAFVCGRYT